MIDFYTAGFWYLETLGALPEVPPFESETYPRRPPRFTWNASHRERLQRGEVKLKYASLERISRAVGAGVGDLLQSMADLYRVRQTRDGKTNQLVTWSPRDLVGVGLERLDLAQPEGNYTRGFALVGNEGGGNNKFRLEFRPVKAPKSSRRKRWRGRGASKASRGAIEVVAQIHARWFYRHQPTAFGAAIGKNGSGHEFTVAAFVDLTLASTKPEDTPEQVVIQHHLYLQHCMERIMTKQTQITQLMSTSYDLLLAILRPGGAKRHPFIKTLNKSERALVAAWRAGKLHDDAGKFHTVKHISHLLAMAVPTVYLYKRKLKEKGIDISVHEKVYRAAARQHMEISTTDEEAEARDDVDGVNPAVRDELTRQARRHCRRLEKTLRQLADSLDSTKSPRRLQPQVLALGKGAPIVEVQRKARKGELGSDLRGKGA